MQVAPAELEAFLVLHPAILEIAVIPILDSAAGELPRAYIVRSPASLDIEEQSLKNEINAYVAGHMAYYKQLKGGIEFVEALPKSVSGKILKRQLKEEAAAEVKGIRTNKNMVEITAQESVAEEISSTLVQVFDFDD